MNYGEIQTASFKPNLFSMVVDKVLEVNSPDQLEIVRWVREVRESDPFLLQLAAGLMAAYAIGQGISDLSNRAKNKPRQWLLGEMEGVPPRENFLRLLQSPPSIPTLPLATAFLNTFQPCQLTPQRVRSSKRKKRTPKSLDAARKKNLISPAGL